MRVQIIIFALICLCISSSADDGPRNSREWSPGEDSTGWRLSEGGTRYMIPKKRLDACPRWDPAKGLEVSCSVGLALQTVDKRFSTPEFDWTKKRSDHRWWLESMSLIKLGDNFWAWKATYEFWPRDGRRMGMAAQRSFLILMDGEILEPDATDKEDTVEQGGADQPATAPESKPSGKENPNPESVTRPQ